MSSISYGIIDCSFSVGSKNASGDFTISATFTNTSSVSTATNCRLSCSLTDSSPWSRIDVGSVSPSSSKSGSVTISSGNTSAQTVYCYLLFGGMSSGYGGGYSVGGYTPPIPDFEKKILYISPSEITMGQKLSISESSGTGVSSVSRTWRCGNSTGSFNTGQWEASIDDFEQLTPNSNSVNATFTTSSSGSGDSGSSSVTVKLKVPENYLPTAEHEYRFINAQNNSLVAGYSQLELTIIPGVMPEDNHATISSCELLRVNTTNSAITVNSFEKDAQTYTSVVLPPLTNVPSYTFSLVFKIIDSRGNQLEYTTNTFRVTNFIPPYVEITNLKRESATKGRINLSINSPSEAYLATIKIGNGNPIDVKDNLVQTQTGYSLDYEITGLQSGVQYNITFTYQDTNMHNYGESPYSYVRLLSTLEMPLSLYDDGSKIYISFGEECSDNYEENFVVNFAKNIYLRYIDDNDNVVCEKVQDILSPCPYDIGDIYQTISDVDPSERWQGTEWEQLTDMFLVGAGDTYSIEETGGEATHTLTIQEMPSHTHRYYNNDGSCDRSKTNDLKTTGVEWTVAQTTGSAGGDMPHNNLPPYYAVYMWLRTA